MVCEQMLFIVVWLLEVGLEVCLQLERTLPVLSEWIDLEYGIRLYGKIIGLIAEE